MPSIDSLFIDSGAFGLWARYAKGKSPEKTLEFYDSQIFWDYVKDYADFVKRYADAIQLYANVDVFYNPKLSWKVQRVLEEMGCHPVPVLHCGASMDWVKFYRDQGYEYIGLGGLVNKAIPRSEKEKWISQVFTTISKPDGTPSLKVHGFGITNFRMLRDYPWWSVDSTSWVKEAAYGGIYIPRRTRGEFDFVRDPYVIKASGKSGKIKMLGMHLTTVTEEERSIMLAWLELIGVPMGSVDAAGEEIERGVLTHRDDRMKANLLYFEHLRRHLPDWPWPFRPKLYRQGFSVQ